ncbi:MAG: hypothetical protein WCK63_10415 [Betaproteobacteria bacterium]
MAVLAEDLSLTSFQKRLIYFVTCLSDGKDPKVSIVSACARHLKPNYMSARKR